MAVFKVDIEKTNGPGGAIRWTNSYHIEAEDIFQANISSGDIYTSEVQMHSQDVFFALKRVSTAVPDDGTFITTVLGGTGEYDSGGDALPAFLAMRVDLSAVVGRGGRKFYHLLLHEAEQAAAEWGIEAIANVATWMETMIDNLSAASTPLCSPNGATTYNAFQVYPAVTQHQFRRGSKRRVPILG